MTGVERMPTESVSRDWLWLLAVAIVTVVLWQIPAGQYALYPFTLLGTWFHEMGHGITAMLLGGNFQQLQIFPNGSGIATHSGDVLFGPLGQAIVAAGGPMGPPIAGALFLLASRKPRRARFSLAVFGIALILSVIVWVRTPVGAIVILIIGALLLLFSLQQSDRTQKILIQILGVQACISTFRDFNYLFTSGGTINGQQFASDTLVIARYLILPHWFWGILIALFSIYILVKSLHIAYRQP